MLTTSPGNLELNRTVKVGSCLEIGINFFLLKYSSNTIWLYKPHKNSCNP